MWQEGKDGKGRKGGKGNKHYRIKNGGSSSFFHKNRKKNPYPSHSYMKDLPISSCL